MNTEEFGKRYLECAEDIANVLRGEKMFDEDLVHDTYIAVYEYSQEAEIGDMVNTFVTFYKNLWKRREKDAGYFDVCDHQTMVEKYDRIDEDDWAYREKVGDRVDALMERLQAEPLPGERNHERAVVILRLYREGLSNVEIAKRLKIDESTVRGYKKRAIYGLKDPSKLTII